MRGDDDDEFSPAVHRIEFDVDWSPGHVAAYLLEGPEPVLVDAGHDTDGATARFRESVEGFGLAPADIEHVVITHPHVDHLGMVEQVREAGDPTVYAPAAWREHAGHGETPGEETLTCVREAGIPESMVEHVAEDVRDSRERVHSRLAPAGVDEWVAAGERVTVGGREFRALAAPGHQRDHLCFVVDLPTERALFSGDMAIETFRAPVLHAIFRPEQHDGLTAYREALETLSSVSVDRVYPGHGPVHDDLPGALELARSRLDGLYERTEAALEPEGTHAVAAAQERVEDISEGPWVPEAVAALAALEADGRAESHVEDGVRLYAPL